MVPGVILFWGRTGEQLAQKGTLFKVAWANHCNSKLLMLYVWCMLTPRDGHMLVWAGIHPLARYDRPIYRIQGAMQGSQGWQLKKHSPQPSSLTQQWPKATVWAATGHKSSGSYRIQMQPRLAAAAASSQTARTSKQLRPNRVQEGSGGISATSWPDYG